MSAADYWPRVEVAIFDAKANRFEVDLEWPECHKNKCQAYHGNPSAAFGIMAHAIANSVESEMRNRAITQPDVSDYDTDGYPVALATFTLAALLRTYAKDAPTYVKAAQLIIDAYPAFVDVLAPAGEIAA